jgi:hypothetical protein
MVFVLIWTIGDASSLSFQLMYQIHFVWEMSSGIVPQSKVQHHYQMWYHCLGNHYIKYILFLACLRI